MTVYELCELYIDNLENMEIWSCDEQSTVFRGTFEEAQYCEYAEEVVQSFEIENGMVIINI